MDPFVFCCSFIRGCQPSPIQECQEPVEKVPPSVAPPISQNGASPRQALLHLSIYILLNEEDTQHVHAKPFDEALLHDLGNNQLRFVS